MQLFSEAGRRTGRALVAGGPGGRKGDVAGGRFTADAPWAGPAAPTGRGWRSAARWAPSWPLGWGDFEICVVHADGSGLRRITDTPGISDAGGWSGDGTRIVFASSREQEPDGVSPCGDIFTVAADGSRLAKLTDGPARDCQPSFIPDGRHILFSSDRADPHALKGLMYMNRRRSF